jgi:hypothetical protein
MATKADFAEEEWKALQNGVAGAGMLVSVGDRDFTDSFGEASALAKTLATEHEQNASELMREIANIRGTGFGLTASQKEVEAETLASLQKGLAALAAKAPEDLEPYRQLVLDAADAVAEAKGGVKSGETAALDKIREALGP